MDNWLKLRADGGDFPKDLHRYRKPRMVQVDWVDTTGFTGWREDADWKERSPNHCRSVGFLMSEDKETLHLAASVDNVGHYNDRQAIPKGCVRAIRQLEVKDASKESTS